MIKKAGKPGSAQRAARREFTAEFRREAVQMMLDGHTAASVAERLGLAGTNLLYRWTLFLRCRVPAQRGATRFPIRERVLPATSPPDRCVRVVPALAIFGRHE